MERNRRWRKEGRNGTLVMSALHSILHGWLAQVNDFLVVFGGEGFGAKAVLNRPLRESESHWALQSCFSKEHRCPCSGSKDRLSNPRSWLLELEDSEEIIIQATVQKVDYH